MSQAWWLALGLVAVLGGAVLAAVLVRRRRVAPDDAQARKDRAQRAIRQMAKDSTKKGSIRGSGQGGDDKLSRDAGYGSDSGGGI